MVNFDETSKIQVNLNSMQGQMGSDFKIPLFKKKKTSESGSSEGKFRSIDEYENGDYCYVSKSTGLFEQSKCHRNEKHI